MRLPESNNRPILENITANLFIRLITYAFSFLTVFYAARILQPEAYGKMAFVSSFTGYFIMLANLGMPIYAMRLCAELKGDKRALSQAVNELWSIGAVLSLFSFALFLALVIVVPRLREDRLFFLIYGTGLLFQAFGFGWLFKGIEKFRFLAGCKMGSKALAFLCMVLFIHSEEQLPLYAVLSVIAAYGSDLVCFFAARNIVDLSFRIRINRTHFMPLLVFFMMSCAVSIYSSLDLTMLGFMKSDYETGLYSVAAKGKTVLTMIGGVVWTSILPQATRLWKDGKKKRYESLAGKSLAIVAAIQLVVTAVCMVYARNIVVIVGGDSYAASQNAFRILMLSLVPVGISNILGGQVLIPAGQEKCLLHAEIVGAAINFIANLFVIPIFSIEGAAATTTLSEVAVALICLYYVKVKLQMNFGAALVRKAAGWVLRSIRRSHIRMVSRIRQDRLPYYCPCCDTYLRRFTAGKYINRPDRYYSQRYAGTTQEVICPICGALPRHRILALWCESHHKELLDLRILYFAQEHGMSLWMKRNGIACTTADLNAEADLRIDIQDTGLPDESFNVIVCNHVLEHVEDFRAALRELYRILKVGGYLICSFPMDPMVELLDDDPKVQTDDERVKRFGQYDHRRIFGMKADCFLIEAGFTVERINGQDFPKRILPVVGPADYDMNVLFLARRL